MIRTRRSSVQLDAVLLTLLFGAVGFIGYRVTVGLHYSWNWAVIPQYIFRYDDESGRWVANYLLQGLLTTIRLSLWSGLFALLFGLFMALARTGRSLFWRIVSRSYVELMRNLPPLVLIFIFYFFLADQLALLLGIDDLVRNSGERMQSVITLLFCKPDQLSAFLAAVLTLALFEGAYITEIIRAGIQGVERQQWEASHALGLTRLHTLRYIILPQAMRQVLPPLAGQFISLIKDSAIVSIISIQELSYQGTQLMASTYLTIEVWVTIAIMYLLLTLPASMGVGWLEKKFARGRA
ncbi:MAG: amino acid ABC transporter permease [Thermodesulfobacteriota bacterium]|nr:amino acid ABC transporter permease [Thermodesulfobacteriota bacterium]